MRTLLRNPSATTLAVVGALASTALPGAVPVAAQDGSHVAEVVSKEIAVSRDEATLRLGLADGNEIEVSFEGGHVHLDGEDLGASDETLESAWRELLGRAVALDDGPLARALIDWEPPRREDGAEAPALDARLDEALEEALQGADRPVARVSAGSGTSGMAALAGRLTELARALDDLDVDELAVHVDEDVEVGEGEEVDATLLVVDGDADIRGTVQGHVVVVGGTLRTYEGSVIEGDVRLSDGRLVRDGGTIDGLVREVDGTLEGEVEARLREAEERVREAEERGRAAAEAARRVTVRAEARQDDGFMAPFRTIGRSIGRGVAGILQTVVAFLVLGALGGLTVMLGRDNLEVVARTARRSPGRAAAVGLAGAFLTFPAWVLGIVALAITIIGIPVMIAWVPLFPLAVALAAVMGYFAVAMNTGEWLSRRRYPYLDWVRSSNPYTLVLGGVVGLLAAFFLANVVTLFGPILGFLRGLLIAAGVVVTVGASLVGFGAVLLTRAGRRPEYWSGSGGIDPFDDGDWDWEPPVSPSRPKGGPAGTGARSGPVGGEPAGTGARDPGPSGGAAADPSGTTGRSTTTDDPGNPAGTPGSGTPESTEGEEPKTGEGEDDARA